MVQRQSFKGKFKAAVLLVAMGSEASVRVMKHLREEEIEQLTLEIAGLRSVAPDVTDRVLKEFADMAMAHEFICRGGLDYAREILEKALGPQKAVDILERLTSTLQVRPFDVVRKTDPNQLLSFIQNENPQTIALLMAYLQPERAASVLGSLSPERQVEVIRRVATMNRTSPEILHEVERVLERKLSASTTHDYASAGGIPAVVAILNNVDRGTERSISETLELQAPELAEEIKKLMVVFEDITLLDDRSVQRVLREVDMARDLPMALRVASEDLKQKIFRNLSKRAVENVTENMEVLGPVRLRSVEEAQAKVVAIMRRLEEQGEIVLARGGGDDLVV
jgi:flagellar motor switch protein FliG